MDHEKRVESLNLIKWILTASAFLCGLSYPFLLFALTVVLCTLLGYEVWKEKRIRVYQNTNVLAGCVYIGAAFLAFLCGIDKGTAFIGFLRVLAAGVWVLFLMQKPKAGREEALGILPVSGAVMVGICLLLYPVAKLRTLVVNHGRLGGAFQYANTMAFYLLLALVILFRQIAGETGVSGVWQSGKLKTDRKKISRILLLFLLLAGIFWTGSRLTFVLSIVVCLWLFVRKKTLRKWIGIPAVLSLAGAVILAAVTGNVTSFGRFLTFSFHESTLLGRLLYWKDAIPLILKHPLGLGWLGYYEIQPLIKTGVYTVRYVHNDWLQIALDHGVIALGAFFFLFLMAWKRGDEWKRLLLAISGVHLFWDPDLAFSSMVFLLLCLPDWEQKTDFKVCVQAERHRKENPEKVIWLKGRKWSLVCALTGILMLWFAVAGFWEESGRYEPAAKMYPFKTSVQESLMVQQKGTADAMRYAKRVVEANPYSSAGWLVQAYYFREEKEYDAMLTALHHYISLKKYDMTAYREYLHMLDEAVLDSWGKGEWEKAGNYREELLKVPQMVREVKEQTDPLAWQIKEKPSFEIPREDMELLIFYQNNPLGSSLEKED